VKQQLYQYVVYLHPTETECKEGVHTRVVVEPSQWTLGTEEEIRMQAVRAIPQEFIAKARQLEVAVRPF
jgi:hypothetical protein